MSSTPKSWTPSPLGQYVTSAIGAVGFIIFLGMFIKSPSWLPAFAAGLMLLTTLMSFGFARSRTARRRAAKTS